MHHAEENLNMYESNQISNLERSKILNRNKGINRELVAAHERLEAELKKLGVEIKPRYGLDHPLGNSCNGCFDLKVES